MKFLSAPSVARPVLFLIAVILVTARLTGGLGTRLFGGDTYGGKKYFVMLAAVLGYFAITNRRIPQKRANLYVALFFLGGATMLIADLPGKVSPAFNFLFLVFPVGSLDSFMNQNSVIERTDLFSRWGGLAFLGPAVFCTMLASYGLRGVLDTTRPWRFGAFWLSTLVGIAGGFRSVLVLMVMTLALLFYLEGLHRTRLLLPVILATLLAGGMATLFSARMPISLQRTLAVLPFVQVDPVVKMSTEISSEWRVQMWRDLLPEVPKYLVVGKGYSFSATEQAQIGLAALEGTELVGDYHNGPLSVILPFGIFGAIAFLWLLAAGTRALYQNCQFGDPAYRNTNTFLFAYFVAKAVFFFTVFGSLHSDLPMFLGLLALGISLNGGVAKPEFVPQPKVVFNRFKLHPSVRRPVGA
jgi:hypothetical protein